ncbi:regulatory protein RecX [Parapedobacter tibetensis]|uniref:regulatory protein RecX n=1 Tax=Parapedobacter tibetensis TaxID=2972951 RepID=UPI00214D6E4C|nr:RecX family transcriptional regulator [Parapedobacter tibetensis]
MDDFRERKKVHYTPQQARAKAKSYCAYQERSQQEVRDKLYAWGLHKTDVETVISDLIADNFLNEERFAIAYALGKFRMKDWGKYKIRQGLMSKSVSAPLITIALNHITQAAYEEKLLHLLQKKAASEREKHPYKRKSKLARYAIGKGYESELIMELLNANEL